MKTKQFVKTALEVVIDSFLMVAIAILIMILFGLGQVETMSQIVESSRNLFYIAFPIGLILNSYIRFKW